MKFTLGLLAGIAVGAAVVHYLHTREGRALVERVQEDVDGVGEKFSALAEDLVHKGKSLFGADQQQKEIIVEETIVLLVPGQGSV